MVRKIELERTTLVRDPDEPLAEFFDRIVEHVGWCVLVARRDGEKVCGVLASASHGHLEVCSDLREQDELVIVEVGEIERVDLIRPPFRWVVPWEIGENSD